MPRRSTDDTGLVVASTAAIGSILLNVAQAIEQNRNAGVSEGLRRDRKTLLVILRRMKKVYDAQQMKLIEAQAALEAAHRESTHHQGHTRILQAKADELRRTSEKNRQDYELVASECARLRARVADLEARTDAKGQRGTRP